jgi:hypothetical protein
MKLVADCTFSVWQQTDLFTKELFKGLPKLDVLNLVENQIIILDMLDGVSGREHYKQVAVYVLCRRLFSTKIRLS